MDDFLPRSSWGFLAAHHVATGDLFLLLALGFLVFAGVAFWLGRLAVGAALAFLAVVVAVVFLL